MTEELKELGPDVGHRRVGRLMRQNAIQVIRTRKYRATTDGNPSRNISSSIMGQDFLGRWTEPEVLSDLSPKNQTVTEATI
jgi:hypothetical protein